MAFHREVPLDFYPFTRNNLMKRNLLLLTLLLFAFASVQVTAQTVKKPFNGTDLTGWKTNGGWDNVWKAGTLQADATTFEVVPLPENFQQDNPNPRIPLIRNVPLFENTPLYQTPLRRRGIVPLLRRGMGGAVQERGIFLSSERQNQNPAFRNIIPVLANEVAVDWNKDPRKGVDLYTEEKFGDCTVKLEFLITKGSNSGVYLMGEYEVQVADSFGKPNDRLGQGDMGAIHSATAPSQNACGEPGTWQSYEIVFVAPKFDADGNKTANAVFKKITLNGIVVQENVEVKGSTGGGITGKESATGPLMLQGNHGPVAFRNIKIIVP